MLMTIAASVDTDQKERSFGCWHVVAIVLAVMFVTALATAWWVKHNIYASEFSPTKLSIKEQTVLDAKLERIEESGALAPVPYSEEGTRREISLTEKELNALIAKDPETAKRVAVDLSEDLVSVKLVLPVEEDVVLLGGKTLRLKMGMTLAYRDNKAVVALRGVTLGGVPLPNAWLGNLKHKNLVEEFAGDAGFWQFFADKDPEHQADLGLDHFYLGPDGGYDLADIRQKGHDRFLQAPVLPQNHAFFINHVRPAI